MMANIIILINILILTSGFVSADSYHEDIVEQDDAEGIDRLEMKLTYLQKDLDILKQNPIPIGFIYVQLSGQSRPSSLWPHTDWDNISPKYAGLFFRVEGGNATNFGQTQEEQSRSLQVSQGHCSTEAGTCVDNWDKVQEPISVTNELFRQAFHTGDHGPNGQHGMNFKYTSDENRPRNQAMRIWVRVK